MRFAHLFALSAMILIVPQVTQAQVTGNTNSTTMVGRSSAHTSIDWAKERLDEMDATLASLEKKLGDLKSENRVKAERAIAEMRQQRDVFKQTIETKKDATEAEWQKTKKALESRWIAFDAAVQKWVAATGESVAEQNEIFIARAEAQLKAWNAKIDQFDAKLKASTNEFSDARRREAESNLAMIRAERDAAKAKLESLKQSGKVSWSALNKALVESRAAFDRANRTAYEAFKRG